MKTKIIILFEEELKDNPPSIKNDKARLISRMLENNFNIIGIIKDGDHDPFKEADQRGVPFIIDIASQDVEMNTFTLINVSTNEKNNMTERQILEILL